MAFESCKQGHFFDSAKNQSCPFCAASGADEADIPEELDEGIETPVIHSDAKPADSPEPVGPDFPVGWLVAVEGPSSGRDYRIRVGTNPIGGQQDMAIPIQGDASLVARNHASLVYDVSGNAFVLQPDQGTSYVNGQVARSAVSLQAGDKVQVGANTLIFIPLAGDGFRW